MINKRRIVIATLLILGVTAGYSALQRYLSSSVEHELKTLLGRASMVGNFDYDDVIVSPIRWAAEIRGLRFTPLGSTRGIRIGALTIYDFDRDNTVPKFAHLTVVDLAGDLDALLPEPVRAAAPVSLSELRDWHGDLSLQYRYDSDQKQLIVNDISISVHGRAALSTAWRLGNTVFPPTSLEEALAQFPTTLLEHARVQYQDLGLIPELLFSAASQSGSLALTLTRAQAAIDRIIGDLGDSDIRRVSHAMLNGLGTVTISAAPKIPIPFARIAASALAAPPATVIEVSHTQGAVGLEDAVARLADQRAQADIERAEEAQRQARWSEAHSFVRQARRTARTPAARSRITEIADAIIAKRAEGSKWAEVSPGEAAEPCSVSTEGLLTCRNSNVMQIVLAGYAGKVPPTKILVSPPSPSGRYVFLAACLELDCATEYVVDLVTAQAASTSTAKYGAARVLEWCPDESCVLVLARSHGFATIYRIETKTGRSEGGWPSPFASIQPGCDAALVDFNTITWQPSALACVVDVQLCCRGEAACMENDDALVPATVELDVATLHLREQPRGSVLYALQGSQREHEVIPGFFHYFYPHPPNPGQERWYRTDDRTWIERSPLGQETIFKYVGRDTLDGTRGSVLARVPEDGLRIFVPDLDESRMHLKARTPGKHWWQLGEMQDAR